LDPVTSSGDCEVNRIEGVGGGYLGTEGNRYAMNHAASKIARHSDGGFLSRLLVGGRTTQPLLGDKGEFERLQWRVCAKFYKRMKGLKLVQFTKSWPTKDTWSDN